MTFSIIIKDVKFTRRAALYDIPRADIARVFGVFGRTAGRTVANHTGLGDGAINGSVSIIEDGVRVTGNANSVRFSNGVPVDVAGHTMIAVFKTPAAIGTAGVISLWEGLVGNAGASASRISIVKPGDGSAPFINSTMTLTTEVAGRLVEPNTLYIVSAMNNGYSGVRELCIHNPDGSVMSTHAAVPVAGSIGYPDNPVVDVGMSTSAQQVGVDVLSAGLWMGVMTQAERNAAAALLYAATQA